MPSSYPSLQTASIHLALYSNYYKQVTDKGKMYYKVYPLQNTENVSEDYEEISFAGLRPDGARNTLQRFQSYAGLQGKSKGTGRFSFPHVTACLYQQPAVKRSCHQQCTGISWTRRYKYHLLMHGISIISYVMTVSQIAKQIKMSLAQEFLILNQRLSLLHILVSAGIILSLLYNFQTLYPFRKTILSYPIIQKKRIACSINCNTLLRFTKLFPIQYS